VNNGTWQGDHLVNRTQKINTLQTDLLGNTSAFGTLHRAPMLNSTPTANPKPVSLL